MAFKVGDRVRVIGLKMNSSCETHRIHSVTKSMLKLNNKVVEVIGETGHGIMITDGWVVSKNDLRPLNFTLENK